MRTDTLRAGIFVATGIVGALLVTIVLSKVDLFERRTLYTVVFSVQDGVGGLVNGSEVRVGGLTRGVVTTVRPIQEAKTARITEIDVDIALDSTIAVFPNPMVLRVAPLLGQSSWIDFQSLGEGEKPIPAGSRITATAGSGILATILGPDEAMKAATIVGDVAAFTAWLRTVPADYRAKVIPALDNIEAITATARSDLDAWGPTITKTLASAESATGKLDTSLTEVQGFLGRDLPKVDKALDDATVAAADLKVTMGRIRGEGLDLLMKILNEGDSAVASLDASLGIVHDTLVERLPDVNMTLEDMRQAVGQLKLASLEVRRSPWKILYRPSVDEVAHENLYGAARSFAMATQDLRAAGDTLREVLTREPDRFQQDAAFRAAVQQQVLDSLGKYEAAERALVDVLMGPKPAGEGGGKP